jgi:hypothetical protein
MTFEEGVEALQIGDRPARQLDDDRDRVELRSRYYGLLQELRVILPGVQVLLAFLLTAPFAMRFRELDRTEELAYGIALVASFLSVLCLLTPAVFHRVGLRTARSARLRWGIRLTLTGLAFLAVALLSALWSVTSFVFSTSVTQGIFALGLASLLGLWIVLPLVVLRHSNAQPQTGSDRPLGPSTDPGESDPGETDPGETPQS